VSEKKKVIVVFGTRPEAIKMASLIPALRQAGIEVHVVSTGQHREMLQPILAWFEIFVETDLNLMKPGQSLAELSARALVALDAVFAQERPDLVLVQGDTTTAMAAALAAFYQRIAVGHVEAGLRTYNRYSPWPEEVNRNLISKLATYHFAPTPVNRANLLREQIAPESIFVTGNTVIDALLYSSQKIDAEPVVPAGLEALFTGSQKNKRVVLITGHRRENLGDGFTSICQAILRLATQFSDDCFVYPVHMNPGVRQVVMPMLGKQANVRLIEPLGYAEFVSLMKRSYLILSDSGGVQEEAPTLGKPVLVMRDTTERPEGVDAGVVRLVGTAEETIVEEVERLLHDPGAYRQMVAKQNPYGDGRAAEKIITGLLNHPRT